MREGLVVGLVFLCCGMLSSLFAGLFHTLRRDGAPAWLEAAATFIAAAYLLVGACCLVLIGVGALGDVVSRFLKGRGGR